MTIAMASTKVRPHWLQCPDCKGYFDPTEDAHATVDDGYDEKIVCINCIELAGETICDDCGEVVHSDDCVDGSLCEDCAEEAGWAKCNGCNDWVAPDDQRESPCNDTYCEECFCERYTYCPECGEVFEYGDMVAYNDESYCRGCAPDVENFNPAGFERGAGCTTKIGSERCFGVELETDRCDDYDALADHGAWGAKEDATVSGKEFFSDVLDGDAGLEAIAALAEIAECNDWYVDDSCGYHLHLDARDESDDSLFAAAYAYRVTEELWHSFVDSARDGNTYSHRAYWSLDDLDRHNGSFERFLNNNTTDRYEWMNLRAYFSHSTFEVRLHHGSIDGEEICNWIKAHTRFMDWATTTGLDGVREALNGMNNTDLFNFIVSEVWKDDTLRDYYAERSVFMRHEDSMAWVA